MYARIIAENMVDVRYRVYLENKIEELEEEYNIDFGSIEDVGCDKLGIKVEVAEELSEIDSDSSNLAKKDIEVLSAVDNAAKSLSRDGFNIKYTVDDPFNSKNEIQNLPGTILRGRIYAIPEEVGEPSDPSLDTGLETTTGQSN